MKTLSRSVHDQPEGTQDVLVIRLQLSLRCGMHALLTDPTCKSHPERTRIPAPLHGLSAPQPSMLRVLHAVGQQSPMLARSQQGIMHVRCGLCRISVLLGPSLAGS